MTVDYKKEIIKAVQQIQSEFTLKHLLGIIESLVKDEKEKGGVSA